MAVAQAACCSFGGHHLRQHVCTHKMCRCGNSGVFTDSTVKAVAVTSQPLYLRRATNPQAPLLLAATISTLHFHHPALQACANSLKILEVRSQEQLVHSWWLPYWYRRCSPALTAASFCWWTPTSSWFFAISIRRAFPPAIANWVARRTNLQYHYCTKDLALWAHRYYFTFVARKKFMILRRL